MRKISVIFCPLIWLLLTGCGAESSPAPALTVNQELLEYQGMTYETFQEHGGLEAQPYHANYFTAQVPDTELTAVFSTGNYGTDCSVVGLESTDQIIRLQGKLSEIVNGLTEEAALDEFLTRISQDGSIPDCQIEEGAGTAYYVADLYAIITLDVGEESADTLTLQVSLDSSNQVAPDAYTWLSWE